MEQIALAIFVILALTLSFINCGRSTTSESTGESTGSIINELSSTKEVEDDDIEEIPLVHTDSMWFDNYVTERMVNPYPDILNPENPDFTDYDKYFREVENRSTIQMRSDTVVENYSIRTYLIYDSLELAYSIKQGFCYYIPKAVVVIDDFKKNHTDSIIIYRKLIENFLKEDLSWTETTSIRFKEIKNDSLVFRGSWYQPDSDLGVSMIFQFLDGKLTMYEEMIPWDD